MGNLQTIAQQSCSTVEEAIAALSGLVREQDGGDGAYLTNQYHRYVHCAKRITQICPRTCRVLDIGSHYLHQASLLRLIGYDVYGIDLPLFAQAPFVVERATTLNIHNGVVSTLADGDFLPGYENYFDLILFTATLEHITFNPVRFWRRVYELLKPNGIIYLTTPNSFRAAALLKATARLATFKGIGIPIGDIFDNVTFGHHWKEYSCREIREYFRTLSMNFQVEVSTYSFLPDHKLKRVLVRALDIFPIFRSEIEAVISLAGKTGAFREAADLPMLRRKETLSKSALKP